MGHLDGSGNVKRFETLMTLSYFSRKDLTELRSVQEKEELARDLREKVRLQAMEEEDMIRELKKIFASPFLVGTPDWKKDACRFVSDNATLVAGLVPPAQHIALQSRRVNFVVGKYWNDAEADDSSAAKMGGCSIEWG
ncbi:hypothetical protein BWQ96_05512 [Gracilariopsis chorda]|uniref:Uncharacterized protein n=1 Tax=Gracilariopsis chorda TaxID=448386 RepID=A0A2V3IRM8_9FLOR|nr:hypothetical protein BWQ96_05512 [Gracilariopsis chorda]|eukprot:PXF44753.1 hypothetical protein BWQ96_05512 [Gracilariopsis chorda]